MDLLDPENVRVLFDDVDRAPGTSLGRKCRRLNADSPVVEEVLVAMVFDSISSMIFVFCFLLRPLHSNAQHAQNMTVSNSNRKL